MNGWNDPSTKQGLAIFLAAFSYKHVQDQDQKLQASSGAAALALCVGASAASPVSNVPIPGIPASHLVKCQKAPTGVLPIVATWVKANVLAMIVTTESVIGPERLTAIAHEQYNAMSSSDTSVTSGSSNTALIVGLIAGGVVLVVVVVLILVVVRRRRRKATDASQAMDNLPGDRPPAGWYPDPAHADRQRYWIGTEWGPPDTHPQSTPLSHEGAQEDQL